jgi:UDP-perosamine 4-acetyltransferase
MNKDKLVILGASGHAKVIIDILKNSQSYEVIGCLDASSEEKTVAGISVLGNDSLLSEIYNQGIRHAFIAIGDNRVRDALSKRVTQSGFELVNVISLNAVISPSVRLGQGIAIMPGVVINVDARIGDNAIINTGACIDHDCVIGRGCHIAPGCSLAGNVVVGEGTFLGVGCKVIPKITIGEWTVAGAGAVVIKDLPPHSVAVGVPARIIKVTEEKII